MSNTWNTASIAMIGNGRSFTFVINGEVFSISDSHPGFKTAMEARADKDLPKLLAALAPIQAVKQAASKMGRVKLDGDAVYVDGERLRGVIVDRIIEFQQNGIDFTYLLNFLERLQANPSKTAIEELYLFLESSKTPMPITEDGHFLAYKKVRSDFKDIHSGTVDYSVGRVVQMPRNKVDDNRNRTCSAGLHFCSLDYLRSFGGSNDPIIIVKIDPADVVSIPSDYNNTKGRTWRMEVLGLHKGNQSTPAWQNNFARTSDYRPEAPRATTVTTLPGGENLKPYPNATIIKTTQIAPRPTTAVVGNRSQWKYFSTRQEARDYSNKYGNKFKDFGPSSSSGYRWAVKR